MDETLSCCLAVSGSVAAVKAPELARLLLDAGVSVDLVLTDAAYSLMQATYRGKTPWLELQTLTAKHAPRHAVEDGESASPSKRQKTCSSSSSAGSAAPTLRIHRDADEWAHYTSVGEDPVLHIELAKRNQLLLIAPLCANTLAQAALGLCGNLLGSVLRAWYYDLDESFAQPLRARYGDHCVSRPVLVAPAMNTFMWHQSITKQHLATLEGRGVRLVPPIAKKLACGDVGVGAMAEAKDVAERALSLLREFDAAGAAARQAGCAEFKP